MAYLDEKGLEAFHEDLKKEFVREVNWKPPDQNGNVYIPEVNTRDMRGARTFLDGESGYVPKPLIRDQYSNLRGDGTWKLPACWSDVTEESFNSGSTYLEFGDSTYGTTYYPNSGGSDDWEIPNPFGGETFVAKNYTASVEIYPSIDLSNPGRQFSGSAIMYRGDGTYHEQYTLLREIPEYRLAWPAQKIFGIPIGWGLPPAGYAYMFFFEITSEEANRLDGRIGAMFAYNPDGHLGAFLLYYSSYEAFENFYQRYADEHTSPPSYRFLLRSGDYIPKRETIHQLAPKYILDMVWPVGRIYTSTDPTSPALLFGGTWVPIEDRFLLAAGTTYAAGATGGEAEHALTAAELANHYHDVNMPKNQTGFNVTIPANSDYLIAGTGDGWTSSQMTNQGVAVYSAQNGFGARSARSEDGEILEGQAHNNMPPYLSVYMWERVA